MEFFTTDLAVLWHFSLLKVTLLSALMSTENRFSEILLFRNLLVTLESKGLLYLFIHASCFQTLYKYFCISLSIADTPAFLVVVVKWATKLHNFITLIQPSFLLSNLVCASVNLGPVHTGTQSFRSISFRSEKWNAQGLRSHGNT